MKKIINPWRNHPEYNCFGCCPENPVGLHMEFYEDDEYIVSTWHPEKNYQGWVNTMHGGILSTLIDERLRVGRHPQTSDKRLHRTAQRQVQEGHSHN